MQEPDVEICVSMLDALNECLQVSRLLGVLLNLIAPWSITFLICILFKYSTAMFKVCISLFCP